jgi:hypothetical protein
MVTYEKQIMNCINIPMNEETRRIMRNITKTLNAVSLLMKPSLNLQNKT